MPEQDKQLRQIYSSLTEAVTGRKTKTNTQSALMEILSFFRVIHEPEPQKSEQDLHAYLYRALKGTGIGFRTIKLRGDWYRNTHEPILAFSASGEEVALIPTVTGRYSYFDGGKRKKQTVTASCAGGFQDTAIGFYRMLPDTALSVRDLLRFMGACLQPADYLLLFILVLSVILLGMLTPAVTNYLFSQIIFMSEYTPLIPIFCLLLGAGLSTFLMNILKAQQLARISQSIEVQVRTAAFQRTLKLPVQFFRNYTPGDLSQRLQMIHVFCTTLAQSLLSTGLSMVLSLIYFFQIHAYAPSLLPAALIVLAAMIIYMVLTLKVQISVTNRQLDERIRESGFLYSMITAIRKIRITGTEKRILTAWMGIYRKSVLAKYKLPLLVKYSQPIFLAISLAGSLFIYKMAADHRVSTSGFMAFMSAYGLITGAVGSLSVMIPEASMVPSILNMIRPLLEEKTEQQTGGMEVPELKGEITISDLRFRYGSDSRYVLDGLNLNVKPGEYLAITGKSGCGKSTLMRIMLGFEEPVSGSVFYDGYDMSFFNRKALRRRIGIVMQDSRLFIGDIYQNISITNPGMSMEDAWKAAEAAGIAEDIRNMPMQMHTLISENNQSISGGQRQRILIARALASQPDILIFDEATSALDNKSQKIVTETLDRLSCTRIIIAHRLSTIRNCDRIVMLEDGRILEEGTYEELMAQNREFAQMVERQQLASVP